MLTSLSILGDNKLLHLQGAISYVGVWVPHIHFAAICFITYFIYA